jgi:hypothetical protein
MKLSKRICQLGLIATLIPATLFGLGLRAFVAVPLAKGDWMLRELYMNNDTAKMEVMMTAVGYGITAKDMIMVMAPAVVKPAKNPSISNVTVLYRRTLFQKDTADTTLRLGLLAGADIATSSTVTTSGNSATTKNLYGATDAGLVATYFKGRNQFDVDYLYKVGEQSRINSYQYDTSWQYRLSPAEFSEWGLGHMINAVVEYSGRWNNVTELVHQGTLGLQYVSGQLVVEGGVVQDLNKPKAAGGGYGKKATTYLLGFRLHL